jgi:hypothetical protein
MVCRLHPFSYNIELQSKKIFPAHSHTQEKQLKLQSGVLSEGLFLCGVYCMDVRYTIQCGCFYITELMDI